MPDGELRRHITRSVVTEPLLGRVQAALAAGRTDAEFEVIIALNEQYSKGIETAVDEIAERFGVPKTHGNYVFATLRAGQIAALATEVRDATRARGPAGPQVYRIWEDAEVNVFLTRSVVTIKADAAHRAFNALGEGIVWAVLDSGIEGLHPHFDFRMWRWQPETFGRITTTEVPSPLRHCDYTPMGDGALIDRFGHGTHVAGIIAGHLQMTDPTEPLAGIELCDEQSDEPIADRAGVREVSGIAPLCRIVSMKVVADVSSVTRRQTAGQGKVSWILRAIDQIQQWNQHGRRLLVHGVNISLGYEFDPRWFACGQSPLCVEVNRLVKSGVVVVVSAGNGGYSTVLNGASAPEKHYNSTSIADPGNADLAITVGATHREMPHTYGVSYFSSRGPTGDGRAKPDLVAPGERILSCAAGQEAARYDMPDLSPVLYCELSGTSMAAAQVSGAIAAFLSVRREFIGEPERVKKIFLASAVDLGRERSFQGAGLIDLMKALQSV